MRKSILILLSLMISILGLAVGRHQCCRVVSWQDLQDGEPISFGIQDGTNPNDTLAYMFRYRAMPNGWAYKISLYPPCLDTLTHVVTLVDYKPRGLFTQPELGNCFRVKFVNEEKHQVRIQLGETSSCLGIDLQNLQGTRMSLDAADWTLEETPEGHFFIYTGNMPYNVAYLCYDNYYAFANHYIGARGYRLNQFPINQPLNQWQDGGQSLNELVDNTNHNYPAAWTIYHWAWCYPLRLCLGENGRWRWTNSSQDSISYQYSLKMPSDNEVVCERGHLIGWATHPHAEPEEVLYEPYEYLALSDSTTLYAVYEIPRQTVRFHTGEYGSLKDSVIQTGWAFPVPEPTVDDGYAFIGWALSPNSTDVAYSGGDLYPSSTTTYLPEGEVNLYAVYEKIFDIVEWTSHSLVISYSGGANQMTVQLGSYNVSYSASAIQKDYGVYSIPIDSAVLSRSIGEPISILFALGAEEPLHKGQIKVPHIIASSSEISSDSPIVTSTMPIAVVCGGELIITGANVDIPKQVNIYGGGKLSVSKPSNVTFSHIMMQAGSLADGYQYVYPQLAIQGQLSIDEPIQYRYILTSKNHSALAVPIEVPIRSIIYCDGSPTKLNENLWINYYDGEARSTGAEDWKAIMNADGNLSRGLGYTIFVAPQAVRTPNGNGQLQNYAYIEMPLVIENPYSDSETYSVMVTAHPAPKPNDAGWNLLGCPYFTAFKGQISGLTDKDGIGKLVKDENTGAYSWSGQLRYVTIPNDNGTHYQQVLTSDAILPAFKNFFIQIGGQDATHLTFQTENPNTAPSKSPALTESPAEKLVEIEFYSPTNKDQIGVIVSNHFTQEYDVNADLAKWKNKDINFYALNNQDELAYIALNEPLARNIALGFSTLEQGDCAIRLKEGNNESEIAHIYLTDLTTKEQVDLKDQSYTFYSQGGVQNNRFKLSLTVSDIETASLLDTTIVYDSLLVHPLLWFGNEYSSPGVYLDTIIGGNKQGADSIGKLILRVTYERDSVFCDTVEAIFNTPWGDYELLPNCECQEGCMLQTEDEECLVMASLCGTIVHCEAPIASCDTTYSTTYKQIREEEIPYTWNAQTISSVPMNEGRDTTLIYTTLNATQCDSIATLHLHVLDACEPAAIYLQEKWRRGN